MGKAESRDNSLIKRVIIALVFGPLIVWIFWIKGIALYVFLVAVTSIGQWELFRMFGGKLRFPHRFVVFISGFLILTDVFFSYSSHLVGIIITSVILCFIIEIASGRENKLENVALSLFSIVYPALFIVFLFKIVQMDDTIFLKDNRFTLLLILLIIWTFDTASYFAGRFIGKHPFFPSISPKKTVEGFGGGIIGVCIIGIIFSFIMGTQFLFHFLVIGVITALAGQIGDLSESIIKRDLGVKDSSNIIPGHGGILDRFDSLIFAGPVIYLYLLLYSIL